MLACGCGPACCEAPFPETPYGSFVEQLALLLGVDR